MSEPVKCEYQVFRGTYFDPPEWCPNDAVEGEEYCPDHLGPDDDYDPLDYLPHVYEGDYE